MKLTKRISRAIRALRADDPGFDDKWWEIHDNMTKAGTQVGEVSSLSISAVFAAMNILAGTVASLPKVVYRRLRTGGKERAFDHPLYDRLHNKPNDSGLTAWQWIYTSLFHKYLWGNWYTFIDRPSHGNLRLMPLLPDRTWRDAANPDLYITKTNGKQVKLPRSQMLHIPHISLAGFSGKGVIHYARESLGITKAMDEFAAGFFGHGTHPGGFVEIEGSMDDATRKSLQKEFNELYGGLGNIWKVIFMKNSKFEPLEVDAEKAQALQSRQFGVVEVARWLNLPPHILRDLTRATYSNIEEQGIDLVVYSLLPLTTQIEQEMNIVFFDDAERKDHLVKFELKGLLQGDIKTRTEFYKAMLDRGVFNADTVLDLEDMNPQPNQLGQSYFMPLNMVNKEMVVSSKPTGIQGRSPIIMLLNPNNNQLSFPETQRQLVLPESRSISLRRRLTNAYKKKFDGYGQEVVGRETEAILAAIKETLSGRDTVEFLQWLDEFYESFGQEVDSLAAPLLSSYADAILPVAQDEINSDLDISTSYQSFEKDYQGSLVERHLQSSKGQLRAVVIDAQKAEESEAEAVEERLAEWEEKRPGKISMRESIRGENAFARSVFALSGIVKIMSVALGSKPCPFCVALDGTIIGIDQVFLPKGDFQPDGAEAPLTVTHSCSHPPYHDGCECGLVASF